MAGQKYPSRNDVETLAQADQFVTNATTPADIGLTAADITRLTAAAADAQTAYDAHVAAQQAARANRTAKDDKLNVVRDILSELNRRVQPVTGVGDATRSKLGIPIYDKTATGADAPAALPFVEIDTAMPLSDEDGKGKPDGVRAAEIYYKIGGAATGNVADYQYQAQDTESPYVKDFAAADAGKQAHYLICWVNSKGERGAFQMASATVTSLLQSGGTV